MTPWLPTKASPASVALLVGLSLGFSLAPASAEPLCRASFERGFALRSRQAFDEASTDYPRESTAALRAPFGDAASHSFVFTNRGERPEATHLLLVLPGSGFHPVYMLHNLERTVPDNTEVAVFEYPYLSPDFKPDGAFDDSEQIAKFISVGLESYRHQHHYDSVGIYASSLGGSITARLLQSGTRVNFLVLDGVQETRPFPFVCASTGWLKDVLPPLLPQLTRVTLISNRNDRKERTKTLRKLPNTASFTLVNLDARHPWEEDEDIGLRTPALKAIFERSL